MIINHNMPALNTYNRLVTNQRGQASALEKLSSGLRINKAADDAAGLAISEKMRSQIRGLDQAGRNAQDGISLIQTAEGALNETHSILQRMRELSVQAANDTNTNSDRGEIQKEVNQLKDEVNRIANTTEFNTKKLLDGTSSALVSTDKLSTKVFMRDGLRVLDQFGQKAVGGGNFRLDISGIQGQAEIQKTDIMKVKHQGDTVQNLQMDTTDGIQHISSSGAQYGNYIVNTNAASATAALNLSTASGTVVGNFIKTGGTIATNAFGSSAASTVGQVTGMSASSSLMKTNFSLAFEVTAITSGLITYKVTGYSMSITGGKSTVIDTTATAAFSGARTDTTVVFQNATSTGAGGLSGVTTLISGTAAVMSGGTTLGLTVGDKSIINIKANDSGNDTKLVDDVTINAMYKNNANYSAENTTSGNGTVAVNWAFDHGSLNSTSTQLDYMSVYSKLATASQSTYYDATKEGNTFSGSVTIEAKLISTANSTGTLSGIYDAKYQFDNGFGKIASLDTKLGDIDRFWDASGNNILDGGVKGRTISIVQGDGKTASINLYSTDTIRNVKDKINAAIADQLGQASVDNVGENNADKFVSYVTKTASSTTNTLESVQGTFVIRSSIAGADGRLTFSGDDAVIKALSLQTIQGAEENKFKIDVVNAHQGTSSTTFVASAVTTQGNILSGIVQANVDVKFASNTGIKATWDTAAATFSFADSVTSSNGSSAVAKQTAQSTFVHLADRTMVLHVGANQKQDIGTGIGNMTAESLGVSDIQVTNNTLANEAIGKLDMAIGRVSGERSKMGALQNRLEHTINNLTTTSENLTAAESRIRDVDMAKEMMINSKFQILSQAATSMLAQANQLPQGVLNLLR